MLLSNPTPRDQIVDFARKMERENSQLRELLSNLCSALLHRMVGDEPTGQEVIALLNAYRAADEFLKPNSLQSKPLTASPE